VNFERLKGSVGQVVQLEPIACELDEQGNELPAVNDDWLVRDVRSDFIRIDNMRTSHVAKLGPDHVHHYTSNPNRREGGYKYGFLTLTVQIFLQGVNLSVRPNSRPGEPVRPSPVMVMDKWVDLNYPRDSGLEAKLSGAGYRVRWCMDTHVTRNVELAGWEVVIESDARGVLTKYRLKDYPGNQTLLKKRSR
jgi:hypothetical protein